MVYVPTRYLAAKDMILCNGSTAKQQILYQLSRRVPLQRFDAKLLQKSQNKNSSEMNILTFDHSKSSTGRAPEYFMPRHQIVVAISCIAETIVGLPT
jgi:hypothetical protein